MYYEGFSKRLAELRQEKGVSARDMSLSLGQSESYINKIENNYAMPSMSGFFYICEYLNISPRDFFNEEDKYPLFTKELVESTQKLNDKQMKALIDFVKTL